MHGKTRSALANDSKPLANTGLTRYNVNRVGPDKTMLMQSSWSKGRAESGEIGMTACFYRSTVGAAGQRRFVRFVAVISCIWLSLSSAPALAQESLSSKDFPFLIYCEYQDIDHAFYFSRLGPDGVAIYLTPDRQAGMITIDGVGRRIGGDQSGTCADRTLDELRSSGQAYDLPK